MNPNETKDGAPRAELLHELPRWVHYVWLIYLGFLFIPLLVPGQDLRWLWPTLLTIPVFLFLYERMIRAFRRSGTLRGVALPEVLAIAGMGYALALVNDYAFTYLIYSVAVAPFTLMRFRSLVIVAALVLAGYAVELLLLGFRPLQLAIAILASIASAAGNYMMIENRRKNLALQRSSEEVQRLARVAERERIGRDLHDLLGHTLSLIAIKSELAARLLDRDRAAAAREVVDVTNIAREALRQVRTAVAGMRAAALESELASARALLETGGVAVTYGRDGAALPAEVETALAMIVRESVTNIQRHAGARHARIEVMLEENASGGGGSAVERRVLLRVSDDGRGGITAQGNGLAGIHERVRSLGGTLELDSPHGGGTVLRVRIPLAAPASVAAVERVGAAGSVRAAESEQGTGVLEAAPVACVRGAPIGRLAPQAKAFESGGSAETGLGLTPDGVRK